MLNLCQRLCVGACLLGTPVIPGQRNEFVFLPDRIGTVEPIRIEPGSAAGWKLSPADLKMFAGNLAALRDLMLKQPVFNPPKGFLAAGNFRVEQLWGRTGIPVRGWGYLRHQPYVIEPESAKPEPFAHKYNYIDTYLYANDPTAALLHYNAGPYFPQYDTPVLFEPHKIGEQQGFEMYTTRLGDEISPFIVLTRIEKPLWIPLSKEGFLQILLKHQTARHAAGDPDYRSVEPIEKLKSTLAKMSPEERREQAIYMEHYDYTPPLAAPGTNGSVPLVVPNPEFFDPAAPRTVIQLVIAEFRSAWNLKDPQPDQWGNYMRVRQSQTLATSDWKGIAAAILGRR